MSLRRRIAISVVIAILGFIAFVVVMVNIETNSAREEQREIDRSDDDWSEIFETD